MNYDTLGAKRGAGKVALVVDDTHLILDRVVGAFRSDGFETFAAENGKLAVYLAAQINPHIIILDLSMPVMNGLDAARALRKMFPSTPIILSTLYAGTLSTEDAAKAGVDVVLPKTLPFPVLIEKAHELIDVEAR